MFTIDKSIFYTTNCDHNINILWLEAMRVVEGFRFKISKKIQNISLKILK